MSCPDCARLERRLADIADAFGADPEDQRDLCVKAREAGTKIEVLARRMRKYERALERIQLVESEDDIPGYGLEPGWDEMKRLAIEALT